MVLLLIVSEEQKTRNQGATKMINIFLQIFVIFLVLMGKGRAAWTFNVS